MEGGGRENTDNHRMDHLTDSSGKQYGEALRGPGDRWTDTGKREIHDQRRENKWNSRWGPGDKPVGAFVIRIMEEWWLLMGSLRSVSGSEISEYISSGKYVAIALVDQYKLSLQDHSRTNITTNLNMMKSEVNGANSATPM